MKNKIKTKVSDRVDWVGIIISFLFITIGVIGFIGGLFSDLSVVGGGFICITYGLIIYIFCEAFSTIVKAAEIYIEKNKNIIE